MNVSNIIFCYIAKYFFNRSAELDIQVNIINGIMNKILYNIFHSIVRDKSADNVTLTLIV
jgi:2-hydroxy-3-keto-5-methylthiopentenyl-1-phosphate phosphatase